MPSKQRLTARPVGRGGEWVVEIARQREFTREQVAEALALAGARPPVGELTIRKAVRAVADGTVDGEADADRVKRYLEELETGDVWGKVAKERRPGAEPTVMVYLPVQYNLERAIDLLTARYPKRPRKAGHRTAQQGLIEATQREPEPAEPDDQERAFWRELLIREFNFPRPPSRRKSVRRGQ